MSDNLIPLSERTKDAQREIQSLGGKISAEKRRAKKTMRDMLDYLLEKEIKTNKGDMTTMEAIMVSMIAKASKGDVRATEFIRDTIGQKPADKLEGTLNIEQALVKFSDDSNNTDTL